MARSFFRGYPTIVIDGKWCYEDTKETIKDHLRPCKKCGKEYEFNAPDPCLGTLPGVAFACCGHGVQSEAYIQFKNSSVRLADFIVTDSNDESIPPHSETAQQAG